MTRPFLSQVITDDSALGGSVIERSLRFNSGDSPELTRTPSGAGDRRTWTLSFWTKISSDDLGSHGFLFSTGANSSNKVQINLESNNRLTFEAKSGGSTQAYIRPSSNLRDVNAWYHFVIRVDTTDGTSSNRIKIYINGTQQTDLANSDYPSQNTEFEWNKAQEHNIGKRTYSSSYFNGYLTEINFIDGYAYDSTYFGYTDFQTGLWRPKRYEGTYGTNGFHLDFSDNSSTSTLGIDKSINGNDFTLTNIATTDSMLDTPTNNFATWNAIDAEGKDNASSFSEGNLKVQIAYQANDEESGATLAFSSGKWYWEEYMQASTADASMVGVGVKSIEGIYANNGNHWRVRGGGGESDHNGSQTNVSGFSWTTGDIIGIAVDMDAGTWTVSKNGTFIGVNIHTNLSGTVVPTMHNSNGSERHTFITNFGQDSSFAGTKTAQGNKDANGIGDFYYPVPSGYKALCSKNLPPNVPSIIRPQKHFETLIYTGNNNSGRVVTGLEFKPDFVWFKKRSGGSQNHTLYDSLRGAGKRLMLPATDGEGTVSDELTSFNDGGFTIDTDNFQNENGKNYVAWCWKAGGAAVTNTDGTINTQVSVNEEAGFSIATYTGNGATTATIGHGLGKTPDWIIIKNRSSSTDWVVMHKGIGSYDGGNYKHQPIKLNSSDAKTSILGIWQTPNSSTQQISDGQTSGGNRPLTNASGDNYVAYFWSEIPGYSKFGYYYGNGSSDGTYVHLGFRPAWLMVKKTNTANSWVIFDAKRSTSNLVDDYSIAEGTAAEATSANVSVDFLSNGVKFRSGYDIVNAGDYIFMAFAEQPGTTSFGTFPNAR